jgi:hypothetical protein
MIIQRNLITWMILTTLIVLMITLTTLTMIRLLRAYDWICCTPIVCQLSSGAVLENSFCMRKDRIASARSLLSTAMEQENKPETLQFIQQIFVLIRPFCEHKQEPEKLLETEGILSIPSLSLMLTYLCHNRARPLLTINLTQTLVVV